MWILLFTKGIVALAQRTHLHHSVISLLRGRDGPHLIRNIDLCIRVDPGEVTTPTNLDLGAEGERLFQEAARRDKRSAVAGEFRFISESAASGSERGDVLQN
jgi:hypothetical protein